MTGEIGIILMAALAGIGFGLLYFGVLWLSVRMLLLRRGAALLVALGFARAGLVIAALATALFLSIPPVSIAAAVAGFIIVRHVATRLACPSVGAMPWK